MSVKYEVHPIISIYAVYTYLWMPTVWLYPKEYYVVYVAMAIISVCILAKVAKFDWYIN